ncbi:MAG: hypothetical protein HY567_00475 [Candidatus Kerfeldbacteria bacterium]|nr:hypothetical protein [Candidatus Kerfeldbacteria bacterium]
MADVPYRPSVKLGSLRQTTKKMMVTKVSGSNVGEQKLKKFLQEDKGLRRAAYGDQRQTMESWRARHYFKDVKEKVKGSAQYRETLYGKKTTATREFRDTVREEVRQDEAAHPAGPGKDEPERQHRLEHAKQSLHRYEQAKQIEREQGKPLEAVHDRSDGGPATSITAQTVKPTSAGGGSVKGVPLAGSGPGGGGHAPAGGTAAPAGLGSTTAVSTKAAAVPPIFGLRGRVLRSAPDQVGGQGSELLVRVLNAPPELAVFIGRDRSLTVDANTRYVRDRASSSANEVVVGDLIDVRGKVVHEAFMADEVYVNNSELPDFVIHLSSSEVSKDVPIQPPSELAI